MILRYSMHEQPPERVREEPIRRQDNCLLGNDLRAEIQSKRFAGPPHRVVIDLEGIEMDRERFLHFLWPRLRGASMFNPPPPVVRCRNRMAAGFPTGGDDGRENDASFRPASDQSSAMSTSSPTGSGNALNPSDRSLA